MAAPCLLAGAVLAVVLWWRARELGRSRATAWIALLLVAANPLTLCALEIGHPEELLGAVLCVAAALTAGRRQWNVSYYSLPFLLALVTWEVHAERRPPVLSLGATLLCWVTLVSLPSIAHPDVQAAAYLGWSVPFAAFMGVRLLGLRLWSAEPSAAHAPAI
jgi:hypothetical protein